MTKKDYIALAKIIKKSKILVSLQSNICQNYTHNTLMNNLCEYLKNDNPSFNEIKFREATGEIITRKQNDNIW